MRLTRKFLLAIAFAAVNVFADPVDWVDPTIGATSHMLVPAYPTVSVPFGMYRFVPPAPWFTIDEFNDIPLFLPSHRASGLFALRFGGLAEYQLGSPVFETAKVRLGNGGTFTVLAPGTSRDVKYWTRAEVGGEIIAGTTLSHADVKAAKTLVFTMRNIK